MRWRQLGSSTNVEDRRGARSRVGRGTGLGCFGLLLLLGIAYLTGENPLALLQLVESVEAPQASLEGTSAPGAAPNDELGQFASAVLKSTEEVWDRAFREAGVAYRPPKLVLYADQVQSACGFGSAAMGPFYCPPDRTVYLDLSFFRELDERFGAPGDFASAYVIAHEVGHHVQNLLGYSDRVRALQQQAGSQAEANRYSVALELMADCLAGVWAHRAHQERQLLEPGDIEEGLNAASAIGDDRLQRMGTGRVSPETFTHGTSAQRTEWLRRGLSQGDPDGCDPFR